MHIAIVDPLGSPYDGSTPSKRALGGSESAVVFITRELVNLGIDVDVFNRCGEMDTKSGRYDQVRYLNIDGTKFRSEWYNAIIVSRTTLPFINDSLPCGTHKILWMHDTFCQGDEHLERLVVDGTIDELWTLSDWHTTYISQCTHGHRRMMEVLKRKIWVTRNGVNVYRDVDIKEKDPNAFIFNSAVNKGMETLLRDIWPRVREKIPDAHLTVIGGAYPLGYEDEQTKKLEELQKQYNLHNDGVIFTGLMPQKFIANHLANAAFMIYPQSFPETYGISTVESLAYGTPVISGRFGAMEETAIDDACYLMDYPVDSNVLYTFNRENHIEHFVNMVVRAHDTPYLWQQKANAALKVREVCGWDKVALQWKQHLCKLTGRYLPVNEYHRVQRINHRTHEIFNKRWSNPEEWAYYPEKENFLEVIVPFYNASQWLSKCVESIATQNYERYRIHFIDDASTDNSSDIVTEAASEFGIRDKILQYQNKENIGALANQVKIIEHLGQDIVVLIDGDDALVNDPNVFKKINRLYHEGAEFTYGSCLSIVDNIPLVAQEYPKNIIESKAFKDHQFPWRIPYTHLRTFSVALFNSIDLDDLRDDNGDYFRASGDTALFYALIERASPDGIKAVRDILYLYNDAHENNDYKINNNEQIKNQETIISRRKGEGLGEILTEEEGKKRLNEYIEECSKTKSILIAIPTVQNIHPETFKSIYEQIIPEGYTTYFQTFYGYCIDQVRNLIAHFALSNHFDYLFCVDYDISFPNDTLKKMLEDNVSLVTGMYIQRKPGEHNLEIYRKNDQGFDYNVPIQDLPEYMSLLPITGCGLGCALIKTEVLKEVGYPQFTYHHALDAKDAVSEDIDFCNKVISAGFQPYVNTTIKCQHHGQHIFEVKNV